MRIIVQRYTQKRGGVAAASGSVSYPLAATGSSSFAAALPKRSVRRQRSQQPGAGAAAAYGGHGARAAAGAAERVRARPAWWPGRRRRPSGNALAAAARRSCVGGVPGQPAPAAGLSEFGRGSCAGGAGWGGSTVHSAVSGCCAADLFFVEMPIFPAFPPRGAAIAGASARWGSRWRLAAPVGERRAGFRGCCTRYRGSAYRVEEQQPTTTPPPRQRGGCRGGRSLLPCAWAGVTKREGEPARLSLLLLSKADRVTVGQVWGCPPPPLGKVLYIGHMQHRGETTQGLCPCTPFHSRA